MREVLTFFGTTFFVLALITYIGSKRKKGSRYERSTSHATDWQKLDHGIDPTEK